MHAVRTYGSGGKNLWYELLISCVMNDDVSLDVTMELMWHDWRKCDCVLLNWRLLGYVVEKLN